jgi:type IV secretion system protein VirB4
LALNPLDCGDDTDRNRHRITTIIRAMLGDFEEDGMEDIISTMLDMAFAVDPPHRTFNELFQASFPKNSKVRNRFADWVNVPEIGLKGLYSHVFNAAHDSLSSVLNQSHLIGINMNEALKDERLGPPVVAHISQAIREAAKTKHGFNIFIDEAANLLQNDGFRHFAMEMYREFRKLNGAVGLAFQDPSALAKSGIADAVLDNTSTLIFFPNANASIESLAPFNLNGEQLDFCRGGPASKGGRRVLIVQRDAADGISESAIVDVDLTPLTDILRFYRAGTDANRHLAALKARWGAQWQQHL